jgi:hypothetical protein
VAPLLHKYAVAVPPVTTAVAVPVLVQPALVEEALAEIPDVKAIDALAVAVQFPAVTVTV